MLFADKDCTELQIEFTNPNDGAGAGVPPLANQNGLIITSIPVFGKPG